MDREKVIRAIDGCINIGDYCNDCDYDGCVFHHGSCEKDLLADTIALLKEQEDRIGVLTRAIEQMPKPTKLLDVFGDRYAKIVRCKNCKYCEYPDAEKEWCKKGHLHGNAETWFCADGERMDDDG